MRWIKHGRTVGITMLAGLWVVWAVGQIVRDASWPAEFAFYFPSPVLLVLLLAAALWAWWRKRRLFAAIALLLAIAPAIFVCCVENRFFASPPAAPPGKPFRLVHWNVCEGRLGVDGVQRELRDEKADLYVLSEQAPADPDALARSLGEEYHTIKLHRLAVVARGSLENARWLTREGGLQVYAVRWIADERACDVFVVDLSSSLTLARDPPLRRLVELIERHRPDLAVGDFNAPRRCRALANLPRGYVHAYDAAGSGWSYTWPMPLPVLAIDQCVIGTRIRPIDYRLKTSWHSDHRRQVLDFVLEAPKEP